MGGWGGWGVGGSSGQGYNCYALGTKVPLDRGEQRAVE